MYTVQTVLFCIYLQFSRPARPRRRRPFCLFVSRTRGEPSSIMSTERNGSGVRRSYVIVVYAATVHTTDRNIIYCVGT